MDNMDNMDNMDRRPRSPLEHVSCCSLLFWRWLTNFLWYNWRHRTAKNPILLKHIWSVPKDTKSDILASKFQKAWIATPPSNIPGRRLTTVLVSFFWQRWLLAGLAYIFWCVCALLQPEIVAWTAQYLSGDPDRPSPNVALCLPFLLMACGIGYALSINIKFHILVRIGIQLKATIQSALISKALRLHVSTQHSGIGSTTNLVSNDTEQIMQAINFLHYLWLSITFVLVVVIMMVNTVGKAALIGFGCLLLLLPLNGFVASSIGKRKTLMLRETDARTNVISQMLEGMEVIKSWSMESAFEARVTQFRHKELTHLRCIHFLRIFLKVLLFAAPTLVAVLTLTLAKTVFGRPLNLVVCLKTLSYLNILRFPLMLIPHALSLAFEARASLRRIETFLLLPECPTSTPAVTTVVEEVVGEVVTIDDRIGSGGGSGSGGGGIIDSAIAAKAQSIIVPCIRCTDACFRWVDQGEHGLTNLSFDVHESELVGITGPVGCGKTLLLHGLLGELSVLSGSVYINAEGGDKHRKIAYFGQTPEIFSMSIKENVCFGLPFEKKRYEEVLKSSCLLVDVNNMQQGDDTKLGERGVNLSGGQKARVAFARCLYSATEPASENIHPPLVLLDDPLSAVDVEVGTIMWKLGVLGMLQNATVLVVLSSRVSELLGSADKVIELRENGTIKSVCAVSANVFSSSTESAETSSQAAPSTEGIRSSTPSETDASPSPSPSPSPEMVEGETIEIEDKLASRFSTSAETDSIHLDAANKENAIKDCDIILKERRDTGRVRCYIWGWHLALSCGNSCSKDHSSFLGATLALLLTIIFSTAQAGKSFTDISLLWYGSLPATQHNTTTVSSSNNITSQATSSPAAVTQRAIFTSTWDVNNEWTAFLYLCVLSMWLLSLLRSLLTVLMFLRSSRELHNVVLQKMLRGPLVWFQRRPHGRILNKFSTDVMKVDMVLPDTAMSLLENLSALFAAFALSVISVPWLMFALLPAISTLILIVSLFRATSREIVRLDGEARSPVYSQFGDALHARVTLRAFASTQRVRETTCKIVDVANSVSLLHGMLDRWNSMRLNGVMSIYAACLFLAAILVQRQRDESPSNDSGSGLLDPTVIGLSLVYALQLMGLSSWTAFTFVQTENALTSVERLYQMMSMPQEANDVKKDDPKIINNNSDTDADADNNHRWPTEGRLTITNLNLRYRASLPLALNNLNLDIRGGERLGIVGRTGAGKSSVFVSLLRLTEPEPGSSIVMDGKELTSVGLRLLRRTLITLIPQNPVVFSGSIRFNLDPYKEHDDNTLQEMLQDLQLAKVVALRDGLDSDCGREGSSFSHGQRQLLVVGRALLQKKKTKVYLLDEATSSMDDATDDIVQDAIRKYAKGITTVTVAHRLSTVLNCDRIGVLDAGRIIQIGKPSAIANEEGSPFHKMMLGSGIPKKHWPTE